MQTLGEFLKAVMNERRLSLRGVERLTGVSHNHVRNVITGTDSSTGKASHPSIFTLKKLAAGLNLPYWTLLALADGLPDDTSPAVIQMLCDPANAPLVESVQDWNQFLQVLALYEQMARAAAQAASKRP